MVEWYNNIKSKIYRYSMEDDFMLRDYEDRKKMLSWLDENIGYFRYGFYSP